MLHYLVERAGNGWQAGELLDHLVAPGHSLAAFDRLAVAENRARRQIALAIGEGFVELHRERMGEVIENVFPRRDVHADVAPFLGRQFGQSPLHERLAGRDDLDDGGMARLQILRDLPDQGRRLHAGQQMAEEALLRALEGGACGGLGLPVQCALAAGDIGRLHRGIEMVVNDGECSGIGIVDAALLAAEPVLDQFVFDAIIGERPCGIEAERPQVAGQHLHGRHAPGLDRLDEFGPRAEREVFAAPEAEPLCIGEIMDRGGAGRGDIDHARVRQGALEPQARASLLRGGDIAAFSLAAAGILHGMAFVEDDDSIEIGAQPIHDLPHPRNLLAAVVGP